jgi:DNA-binding MarR family transcriptional regulator
MVSLPYHLVMQEQHTPEDAGGRAPDWRRSQLGRLLGHAMRRFDERVLYLMAHQPEVPLALSNLAARQQISAAHIHITRHLSLQGSRLSELADSAGMTKQSMGDLVNQCEAWGLVRREADSRDARAKVIRFTPMGLDWLHAFEWAVQRAEAELREQVGPDVATVLRLGLEIYAGETDG